MSTIATGTPSTLSLISSTSTSHHVVPRLGSAPPAALLLEVGYPGIQYTIVDPGNQYQKYLIVKIQCPSGTDPLMPPNFNARLQDGGITLEMTVPVTDIFSNTNLLVHRNATWMRDGDSYENARQTMLGGLGPAIAQLTLTSTVNLGPLCGAFTSLNLATRLSAITPSPTSPSDQTKPVKNFIPSSPSSRLRLLNKQSSAKLVSILVFGSLIARARSTRAILISSPWPTRAAQKKKLDSST